MKRKTLSRLLVFVSVLSMVVNTVSPVFADEVSTLSADITQEVNASGSKSATVSYEQSSNFVVTIPKVIQLGSNKSAEYQVKVDGDIMGNETITVTPDTILTLSDNDGKEAVTGTITQTKTEFTSKEISKNFGGAA